MILWANSWARVLYDSSGHHRSSISCPMQLLTTGLYRECFRVSIDAKKRAQRELFRRMKKYRTPRCECNWNRHKSRPGTIVFFEILYLQCISVSAAAAYVSLIKALGSAPHPFARRPSQHVQVALFLRLHWPLRCIHQRHRNVRTNQARAILECRSRVRNL